MSLISSLWKNKEIVKGDSQMKCSKCGKEVSLGDVYCSQCGTEIQIVPDYNVFGDDFSNVIQKKENERIAEAKTAEEEKKEAQKDKELKELEQKVREAKRKNTIILSVSLGVIALIAVVLIISIFITTNKNSKSFNYNYSMAQDYFTNGMLNEALEYADYALKADEDNVYAGILKAEILGEQKNYEAAIDVLETVISYHPSNNKAYNLLIKYCVEISDFDTIAEYAEAVKEKQELYGLFKDYIVEVPEFSVKAGSYNKEISLSITTDSESIIYYTTNGTSPKNNGILYTDEILLTEGVTTVRAYATNEHGVMSEEIEATYIIAISLPDKPEATVPSGTYKEAQLITIYVPVGWTAYYTWDGTIPTLESNVYTEPFEMIEGNNVLAIIFINDQENHKVSDIAYYNYIYYPEESEGTSGDSDADSEENDGTAGSDESDDTNN